MDQKPIEETIKQTEKQRRKGNFRKGLTIALTTGILGYTTGRVQESKTHKIYQTGMKTKIAKLAIKGYTFKEDSDPTFYFYQAELSVDSANKKMQGIMIKEDGIYAGPIRNNARIGYSVPERTIQESKKTFEHIKEKGEEAIKYGREKVEAIQKHLQK